jgi:hypothetical protein
MVRPAVMTRSAAKRARQTADSSSASARPQLLELPEALALHILSLLSAREMAVAMCVSSALRALLPVAAEERARTFGHSLPGPESAPVRESLECVTNLSRTPQRYAVTHALRFVEQVAARQRSSISADTCHTLCVQPDGVAYAWGAHELGPEGPVGWVEGDEAEVAEECWLAHLGLDVRCGPPVRLPARLASLGVGHAIREVAAGYCHSLFLCAAGQVWACGVGEHGRLGLGDELATPTTTVPSPTRIKALSGRRMVQVAAGGFQSLALCDQGRTCDGGHFESLHNSAKWGALMLVHETCVNYQISGTLCARAVSGTHGAGASRARPATTTVSTSTRPRSSAR